jgi:DNA-binding transcriptional LysR family regulator
MIDLRRLRVLRAVAHYGTVTAAAEALHFTPSAASQQIRQLSRELGVTLLEPHGRRIRLTPAAHSLLAHADAIEARWERAETDLRGIGEEPAGQLRLGGFPVAVSTMLGPVVARLRKRHPRLSVQIRETEPGNSFDLLFEGEIDLAIIEAIPSNPPMADSRFDQRSLLDDRFDLIVSDDHRFAGRTDLRLAEAAKEDWILPMRASTCREHIVAACSAAGFTPHDAHYVLEWNAIAHLVAHQLGVALVPRLAHLAPHLAVTRVPIAFEPRPCRKLLTATRTGGCQQPGIAAALKELRQSAPIAVAA